jgi:predicted transcriptional regulator
MKEKISITLSKDILTKVDRLAGSKQSRAAFIERVLRQYLGEHTRAALDARDVKQIDRASERLNDEAADVLEYQTADPDAQFRAGVRKGLEQAERGQFIEESEMDARVRRMFRR